MASLGDWTWKDDASATTFNDTTGELYIVKQFMQKT